MAFAPSSTMISLAVLAGQGFIYLEVHSFAKGEKSRKPGLTQSHGQNMFIKVNQNFIHMPESVRIHDRWALKISPAFILFPLSFLGESESEGLCLLQGLPKP